MQGVVYDTDKEKFIESCFYSFFAIDLVQEESDNAETVMSRLGNVITYVECSVLCCSKLHTKISLSTTEV